MATRNLTGVSVKSSGRTLVFLFDSGSSSTSPTYNGGLTINVGGNPVTFAKNTALAIGSNPYIWKLYVTLDSFVLPTDVLTVTATAGMLTGSGDSSAAFTGIAVTNGSNRQADLMDTLCVRFNETPYRYLTGTRKIGVVGFDNVTGNVILDRVEFSINGGSFVACDQMAWNSDNSHTTIAPLGVWEYFVSVNPSGYSDGDKITVTARAFPGVSTSVYKEITIDLWANVGGTCDSTKVYVSTTGSDTLGLGTSLLPYRNLVPALLNLAGQGVHGGQIEIKDAGTYILGTSLASRQFKGFVTIAPAAGVTAANVIFQATSSGGTPNLLCNRLHFLGGMTFDWSNILRISNSGGGSGDYANSIIWHDGNIFDATSGNASSSFRWGNGYTPSNAGNATGVHCTACTAIGPVYAFSHIQRSLNCRINQATADVQSNAAMTVNLYVHDGIALGTSGPHGDGFQQFDDDHRATIVYGLYFRQAIGYQGNYWTDLYDHIGVSIVNVAIDQSSDNGVSVYTQLRSVMENILLLNLTNATQLWDFRTDWNPRGRFTAINCISLSWTVEDTSQLVNPNVVMDIDYNHFVTGTTRGTHSSTGAISVSYSGSSPVLGYGGPGSLACKTGKNYTEWRHPGVLLGGVDRRGAFGLTGDVPSDLGGAVASKPSVCVLNTSHETYSSWRRIWAFDATDDATWTGGSKVIRNLASGTHSLTPIVGQTDGTWDNSSAYGRAVVAPKVSTNADTDTPGYPFQLVSFIIDGGAAISASPTYPYTYCDTATNRGYQIKRAGAFANIAAIQSRFGSETGALLVPTGANKLILLVAQFISDTSRKLWMFVIDDASEQSIADTTAVTAVIGAKDSVGALFGSSYGSSSGYAGKILAAGRTNTIWSDAVVRRFAADPWAFLIQASATPTGLAVVGSSTLLTATLTWNPVVDATGYRVYRDGVLIYNDSTAGVTDTGLSLGVTYTYTVSSYNGGGESAQSSGVSLTLTQPVVGGLFGGSRNKFRKLLSGRYI